MYKISVYVNKIGHYSETKYLESDRTSRMYSMYIRHIRLFFATKCYRMSKISRHIFWCSTYLLDIIYLLTSPCCHQASNAHTNLTLQAIVREEGNEASVDDDDPVHLEKCEEDSNKWSQNSIQIFVRLQNVINPLKNCLSICLCTLFR